LFCKEISTRRAKRHNNLIYSYLQIPQGKKAGNISVLVYGIGHTLSGFEQNGKYACNMNITDVFYELLKQERDVFN
jgi:hypothetical protein